MNVLNRYRSFAKFLAFSCVFKVASSKPIPSAGFLSQVTPRYFRSFYSKPKQSPISQKKPMMKRYLQEAENPLISLSLPSPLILGSGSFTRKLILDEMRIPYLVKVRPINERKLGDRSDGSDPSKLVMTLAQAKCDHLAEGILTESVIDGGITSLDMKYFPQKEYIILTADQVVTWKDRILEKPDSIDEAKAFVKGYGEVPPSTVGAVILKHFPTGLTVSGVDIARIVFSKKLADRDGHHANNLIDRLYEENQPILSCAGGLMIEHSLVKEYIEHIDGTEDSVMGLSKALVMKLLKELRKELKRHGGL